MSGSLPEELLAAVEGAYHDDASPTEFFGGDFGGVWGVHVNFESHFSRRELIHDELLQHLVVRGTICRAHVHYFPLQFWRQESLPLQRSEKTSKKMLSLMGCRKLSWAFCTWILVTRTCSLMTIKVGVSH